MYASYSKQRQTSLADGHWISAESSAILLPCTNCEAFSAFRKIIGLPLQINVSADATLLTGFLICRYAVRTLQEIHQ